jgi:CTP:molybdopterin cytidylyltransferase MocA
VGTPAIVAAGDGKAAKAVYGESKVYLPVAGRPMVAHVVGALQQVPEVSEIWVVGNARRLAAVLEAHPETQGPKPVHVVEQFRNLSENLWETWRRTLPGAPPQGRDPAPGDADCAALFLSGDLPLATPHEISAFLRRARERDGDFACGLIPESAMEAFRPKAPGEPGIEMAQFNIAEGRFRQSNLFWVKPARLGNRYYVEEMYEHRYQKQLLPILGLAWRLLTSRTGGLRLLFWFGVLQLASIAHRLGLRGLADRLRAPLHVPAVERMVSRLLDTRFYFVVTEVGGCAVDVDNEADYDACRARIDEWYPAQLARGEALYGALPERAGSVGRSAREESAS